MKFGLYLPIYGGWFSSSIEEDEKAPSYGYVKKVARRAEKIGIDTLWIPDHLLNPLKGEESPSLEAWTLASAIAETTEKVDISHTTICEAFRRPAVLAKKISTLQEIIGGRYLFSIGAGWYRREYEAYGLKFYDHDDRIDKAREAIELIERLWEEDGVDYEGRYYQVEKGLVKPKPDPVPPIWYAGMSGPSRELVAEKADGWLMAADETADIEEHIRDMGQRLKEVGRDPSEMEYAAPAITFLGETDEKAREKLKEITGENEDVYRSVQEKGLVGSVESVKREIEKREEIGLDRQIFQLTPTLEEMDMIERIVKG